MEVVVIDVANPPAKPVLAIKAGTVRRQRTLEVNQSFLVPRKSGGVQVTLFQQLASQLLPDDGKPEVVCNIPVRKPDGAASQVKLRIQRGEPKGQVEDAVALTREYLEQHKLQQCIQNLIQDVLRHQPDDPFRYMLDHLRSSQTGGQARPPSSEPQLQKEAPSSHATNSCTDEEVSQVLAAPQLQMPVVPLAPRPPDQPKPSGGRPVPGGRSYVNPAGKDKVSSSGRSEAQKLAHEVIRMVLRMPACVKLAENCVRLATLRDVSGRLAVDLVDRATESTVSQAVTCLDVRLQAQSTIRTCLRYSVIVLSPQYTHALTRWTVGFAFRGAARILSESEELRESCFQEGIGSRQPSPLPMPMVYLGSSSSWGQWLSATT